MVLATLVGAAIGLFLVSANRLLKSRQSRVRRVLRNVPLLVQLFFLVRPDHRKRSRRRSAALQPLPGVFLSNRGIFFPAAGQRALLEGFNFSGGLRSRRSSRRCSSAW